MEMLSQHALTTQVAFGAVVAIILFAAIAFCLKQRALRLAAESTAAEGRERLESISSVGGLGFWKWDCEKEGVWADKGTRNILGVAEDKPLSIHSCLASIHPEDRSKVADKIHSSAADGEEMEVELRMVAPGGEIRGITARARVSVNSRGVLASVAGYVIDDGRRRGAESDLLNLQKKLTHLSRVALLGELSGALAHELQQPLTAILSNTQAVQYLSAKEPVQLTDLREILGSIVGDAKHAGQIIQRLRALLLRGETEFQPLEIQNVLTDVLTLARGTLMEHNVQVNTRIDQSVPAIRGDAVELQQVLLNLVLNACDSMVVNPARDRRVEIVVGLTDDGSVRTSVLDCGKGIDSENLDRVFDPFFTTKEGGLGLGLSISHSIVIAHGGRLWATNRADRGAAFHFTLPIPAKGDIHEEDYANSVHC
jgi:C4-dicarboxylate-specific signal transduction histidine kinase